MRQHCTTLDNVWQRCTTSITTLHNVAIHSFSCTVYNVAKRAANAVTKLHSMQGCNVLQRCNNVVLLSGNDRNGGINFYSIMMKQNQLQINKRMQGKCSKLPQNCLSYSMVTCAQLAIVQWSHVTWLFLPGNTCSNHCDVKTRFVTLNFSHTLHKNNWQNTHYNSW